MLTESYLRGGKIVFLFYDAYDRASFEKIDYYYRKFLEFKYPPIFILIRNKFDLNMPGTEENIVTDEEAFEYADKNNMLFFHLSNYEKYESGIEEIFQFALNYYKKNIKIEDGERNRCTGVKKPVIYLYPEKPMDISVQLKFKKTKFTAIYPKFNEKNTWNVHAQPNGDIYIKDKLYPYLFWEADSYNEQDTNEGFIVSDEEAEKFLEEKLDILGLNDNEKTDFITFWLPVLLRNKLSLCSFQTQKFFNNFELNITPKPESLIRVFLTIKKLEKPINICYIGAGYVGGTSGSVMAYKCPEYKVKVTICDTSDEKIKAWNSDKLPI